MHTIILLKKWTRQRDVTVYYHIFQKKLETMNMLTRVIIALQIQLKLVMFIKSIYSVNQLYWFYIFIQMQLEIEKTKPHESDESKPLCDVELELDNNVVTDFSSIPRQVIFVQYNKNSFIDIIFVCILHIFESAYEL